MRRRYAGLAFSVLVTGAIWVAGSPAPAQHQKDLAKDHARANSERHLKELDGICKLTADQKNKIKPIIEEAVGKVMTVHDNKSLSDQDRRAKMKQIHDGALAKIKQMLTPDQRKKLEEAQKQARKKAAEANKKAGEAHKKK